MAFKTLKLNLKTILVKEAKTVISSYKRLISSGKGVELDASPKKKKGRGKWMKDTGETNQKGYGSKVTKDSMLIFAKGTKHSGKDSRGYQKKNPPTYRSIFRYHNQAQGWSGVFKKLPAGSKFPERVTKAAGEQIYKWAKKNIKVGKF